MPSNVDNGVGEDERTRRRRGFESVTGVRVEETLALVKIDGDAGSAADEIKTSCHPSCVF